MQVIVRDRREGKTTELIKWLLAGEEQQYYPRWSRVIVTPIRSMVPYTSKMIDHYIRTNSWNPCKKMLAHANCENSHFMCITDIRKSVWNLRELTFNLMGANKSFEYAVDDVDVILRSGASINFSATQPPALITVTGKLYNG